MIEERKDACIFRKKYEENMRLAYLEEEQREASAVKSSVYGASSPSRAGSPSPGKRMTSPAMKLGGKDLNNTAIALRSIGGSSDGRANKSLTFLEPPLGNARPLSR